MWRFIALALLLIGVAGFLRLFWGGFVWKNGLSNEAITVLFAGLMAFLAVMIQIEEDRIKVSEERNAQRRAVVTAILFEIDDFYHYGLKQETNWETFEASQIPYRVVKFRRWPFVMYEANAGRIGNLDYRTIKSIIKFYGDAEAYQASVEEFVVSSNAARSGSDTARLEANALLENLKKIFPAVQISVKSVCATLSNVAGVPREDLRVPLSDYQGDGERIEKGQKSEHDA
jgi:hypothetical protein